MENVVNNELNTSDVVVEEEDFNEIIELQKNAKAIVDKVNELSGAVERIKKDINAFLELEHNMSLKLEEKKKALIKYYKIDDKRPWQIEPNTRKITYK